VDTPPPKTKDGVDWGEFTSEETKLDEVPVLPESEIETGPHDLTRLPGYDLGRVRGHEEFLCAFRLAQIQGGTDPGVAHLLAERLRRWMRDPDNLKDVRAALTRA
jgi:hypothetical protein